MSDATSPTISEDGGGRVITLEVPALPEYLYLVRLNASGLASRLGFSYEEVEDLRLAIDELCFSLIGAEGRQGTVCLTYQGNEGGLVVDGIGRFMDEDSGTPGLSEFSRQILGALVDSYELSDGDRPEHRFRLTKRAVQDAADRGQ